MTLDTALHLTVILASVGLFVTTLEELQKLRLEGAKGILSWEVLQHQYYRSIAWTGGVFTFSRYTLLKLLRLLGVLVLPFTFGTFPIGSALISGMVLFSLVVQYYRCAFGLDGTHQVYIILFLSIALYGISSQSFLISYVCLAAIALQSVLAYVISGYCKLVSQQWRDGSALIGIMSTKIYGNARLYRWFKRHPQYSRLACWGVIVFELAFIACCFFQPKVTLLLLGLGFSFHLVNAFAMGLNNFLMAFIATYPAVYYCFDPAEAAKLYALLFPAG
ncbi:MAG: hypothetical protein AAFW73_06350 [Bacteroidota bacterium]